MKLLRQTSKLQQVVLIRVVTRVTSPLTEGSTGTSSVSKLARWLEDGLGAPLLPILLLAGRRVSTSLRPVFMEFSE